GVQTCALPISFGGALLVRPWPRFHTPLIEPDRQICRVAQPLLAFAPTEPTVRRYRSGLFRKDLRRVDHRRHAWWITGPEEGRRSGAGGNSPSSCSLFGYVCRATYARP